MPSDILFTIGLGNAVFKISAGPQTLTGKNGFGPAGFPSLPYIKFGKIVLQSGKFQVLFRRLLMAWHLTGTTPVPEPMLTYWQLDP